MIYILIPVYNESLNIDKLFKNLSNESYLKNAHFVFVDDYSDDNTLECIREKFKEHKMEILTKSENIGPGHSFNIGFEWILNNSKDDNDMVITMEADNTSSVTILENMIKIFYLGYNLVLASPYSQGGGFKDTTFFRKSLSLIANIILRAVFSVKVQTLSSFYRIYKVKLLRAIKEKYGVIIFQKGFISMLEILLKSIKCNADIIEIPMILESGNRKGKSKMKTIKTSLEYLKFLLIYGRKI